jgi:arylsulfatase A-like enzyme
MQSSRRAWLHAAASALVCAALPSAASSAQTSPAGRRRPNVLLIIADDQGYGDLSSKGNPDISTPHIDRLAEQATEFTRFYVCPVCAPTRAGLLTGRYHLKTGVHGVTAGKETMATDETTIGEAFQTAGYRTALIGKWHLGEAYPNVPHAQGFDTFIGMRNGHWLEYYDSEIEKNGKPYIAKGYIADALTNEAIRYLRQHRDEPMFVYLPFNTPHFPYQVPFRYWKKFVDRGVDVPLAAIYGMVENIDDNVGRLLAEIDRLQLAEDTIVIYMSDNGPNSDRYVCGLRGRKGSVYEGGVRSPFFIRWPGKFVAGRKVDRIASHIDIYPTLAALCGVERPEGLPIDGVNLQPLLGPASEAQLARAEAQWPERDLFTHREREGREDSVYPGAVRTQRYNLVNGTELYDIEQDPGEQNNIAANHPQMVSELKTRYEAWFAACMAARGFEQFPLPVGYAEENPVYLPATRATFTGKLRYNGKFGYSHDWITDWIEPADVIRWEVDVVEAGNYQVDAQYLCPESSIGSRVELRAGAASCQTTVNVATEVEPMPDRNLVLLERNVLMPWKRLRLGELRLPKGKSTLELRCLAKPGEKVMDVKALWAERI